MLGAILGDIIGSPYEFSEQVEGPDAFPLFSKDSRFTDDTVLTLAVANGILEAGRSRAREKSTRLSGVYTRTRRRTRQYGLQEPPDDGRIRTAKLS